MPTVGIKEGFLEEVNKLLTGWRHSRQKELIGRGGGVQGSHRKGLLSGITFTEHLLCTRPYSKPLHMVVFNLHNHHRRLAL